MKITLTGQNLTIEDVVNVSENFYSVELSEYAAVALKKSHAIIQKKIENKEAVYGVTTGFGKLASVAIDTEESLKLQKNLIMSHACGVGEPFPTEIVRAIMLLRVNALARGFSGVNPQAVEILVSMLNAGVHPLVPMKGSLGASGDLCHLAHVALVMIGLGEAVYNGDLLSGADAMAKAGIPTMILSGKDGLALINGTQAMSAIGVFCLNDAIMLMRLANACAALTMEALQGQTDAYDAGIHALRPHRGQIECAAHLRSLLEGSGNVNTSGRVQDAYTLRCVPQVHGASCDAINYVKNVIDIEINSVTDNPIVLTDDERIISGGNFHGQPLAFALDFLAIALSELANISERRIERLVNPQLSGLPAFLTEASGINSGFMILQYTAACLVSENKILASPASVDSIPSSGNQEDHVSMGAISARKAAEIVGNLKNVLAIELMCAAQAIDLRGAAALLSPKTAKIYSFIREAIEPLKDDRVLYTDIRKAVELIENGCFNEVINF